MLITTGTPRYTPIRSGIIGAHVIWDHALGAFCMLEGEDGTPTLLTFDYSVWVLQWFMACQEGGLELTMPEGAEVIPRPRDVL